MASKTMEQDQVGTEHQSNKHINHITEYQQTIIIQSWKIKNR